VADGQDLDVYADTLLGRFANPMLAHRLDQIATDGSQKIGPRWLEPLAIARARGMASPATLQALAAWLVFVRGDLHAVADPLADRLSGLWNEHGANGIVDAVFGDAGLLPATSGLDGPSRRELTRIVHERTST
jgi:fructuronate reductase